MNLKVKSAGRFIFNFCGFFVIILLRMFTSLTLPSLSVKFRHKMELNHFERHITAKFINVSRYIDKIYTYHEKCI